uniref:Calpain catalytic domain-containing protein n=1 Tax=Chromera velia CCMP2878 TaxID=1169474 RepID=A0A0G4IAI3_9ALVE|eukprot:Cvel_12535.t1-p1 / transcript=Cvel_12535.t1 / gene=Cvel_12535 / organism=Chromera_velia_CCMP2878 / gene_product=Calpain-12, putative / transcript_product=Calpain-12, putative / location=Cvel_scaffold823:22136-34402(-) / protein_length=769 / sequence_SO=supercontig / SO=protein_coding / is_pseudo=false
MAPRFHSNGECACVGGRQGTNNIINGVYRRLADKMCRGAGVYFQPEMNLYLYKSQYEALVRSCPRRVICEGELCEYVQTGYERLDADFNGRPAYKAAEKDVFLYFMKDTWKIGEALGEGGHFALAYDMLAVTPLEIGVVWEAMDVEAKVCRPDPSFRVVAYEEGQDNDLVATGDLRSEDLGRDMSATLVNRCDLKVDVFWVDGGGHEVFQGSLNKNQTFTLRSLAGHAWRVRRNCDGGLIFEDVFGEKKLHEGARIKIREPNFENVEFFSDPEFPASDASLGPACVERFAEREWIRASHLAVSNSNGDTRMNKLFDEINPADLRQGQLGNCWLIAALACVAEFPGKIENLFETKRFSREGKYAIRLYDVAIGQWVTLVIDDFIPCLPKKWPLLLEKAFAKFCGGYSELRATKRQVSKADFFILLKHWDQENFLLAASRTSSTGGEVKREDGLVEGHAYSFIRTFEDPNPLYLAPPQPSSSLASPRTRAATVPRATRLNNKPLRLVQLRNPWGMTEWIGRFSVTSDEWDRYPEVQQKLWSDDEDGTFWMEYGDFIDIFQNIQLCPLEKSNKRATHRKPPTVPRPPIRGRRRSVTPLQGGTVARLPGQLDTYSSGGRYSLSQTTSVDTAAVVAHMVPYDQHCATSVQPRGAPERDREAQGQGASPRHGGGSSRRIIKQPIMGACAPQTATKPRPLHPAQSSDAPRTPPGLDLSTSQGHQREQGAWTERREDQETPSQHRMNGGELLAQSAPDKGKKGTEKTGGCCGCWPFR